MSGIHSTAARFSKNWPIASRTLLMSPKTSAAPVMCSDYARVGSARPDIAQVDLVEARLGLAQLGGGARDEVGGGQHRAGDGEVHQRIGGLEQDIVAVSRGG